MGKEIQDCQGNSTEGEKQAAWCTFAVFQMCHSTEWSSCCSVHWDKWQCRWHVIGQTGVRSVLLQSIWSCSMEQPPLYITYSKTLLASGWQPRCPRSPSTSLTPLDVENILLAWRTCHCYTLSWNLFAGEQSFGPDHSVNQITGQQTPLQQCCGQTRTQWLISIFCKICSNTFAQKNGKYSRNVSTHKDLLVRS